MTTNVGVFPHKLHLAPSIECVALEPCCHLLDLYPTEWPAAQGLAILPETQPACHHRRMPLTPVEQWGFSEFRSAMLQLPRLMLENYINQVVAQRMIEQSRSPN